MSKADAIEDLLDTVEDVAFDLHWPGTWELLRRKAEAVAQEAVREDREASRRRTPLGVDVP